MRVVWRARQTPLEPLAVAATGGAARTVASRLLERTDDELARLRGLSWANGLALEGPADALPWADGAAYFGRDPRAPKLLLPCALEPDAPLELWARALERALPRELAAPTLVLPDGQIAVSLAGARGVERVKVEEWLRSLEQLM